jgi:cholest-4-en-3-one 26-monooxygenase
MNIDVYSPDVFHRGIPYDDYRRLRREAPVYFHPEPNGPGFWAISKYADVVAISRDPQTFSSHRGGTFIRDPAPDDLQVMQQMMLNMDPPQHIRFRNIVKHAFVPRVVAGLDQKVRRLVDEILDQVAPRGECEFVHDIACQLPLRVVAEMLGIPDSDREMVYNWSNKLVGFDDPELQESWAAGTAAAVEMFAYAGELAQRRFAQPGDDVVSMLMKGVEDGGLSPFEFASFFMLLFVAGNETTRNLISGGMLALIEHPAERARLTREPELINKGVEEMLRWVTPLIQFRRTATRDVELRGQQIRENDKVVLMYHSANRDEEVFPDADRFDVGRTPNEHLAFGIGQHFCLGNNLARLEARVMFAEILKRLPDLELAGEPRRLRSNFVNAWKTIPVRFTAERGKQAAAG